METTKAKRRLTGVVVPSNMQKTIVVKIDRTVVHPTYGKRYTVSKRYKVHAEGDKPEVGATVVIEECRPLSKDKRFRLIK